MTAHLFIAWGPTYETRCRRVEWDYGNNTVDVSSRICWQGKGPRCKRCKREAAVLARDIQSTLEAER